VLTEFEKTKASAFLMSKRPLRQFAACSMAGVAVLGIVLTGCAEETTHPAAHGTAPSMPDMSGMAGVMNDPAAIPASELPGATESAFGLLNTRPPGTDSVRGTAWLAQHDAGTSLTVTLTGLTPGDHYLGHLHAQPCAERNGGPHFKFEPGAGDLPPNEVHLGFTADASGNATATVTNQRQVGDGAKSVVIHPSAATDNRLACADF
jgi:Cu/Zn superoxide dismutase